MQDCFLSNHLCRTQKPGRQVMRSRGEADHTDRCALCERMPRALSADCPQCNARGTDGRADRLLSSITARPCGRSKTDRDALGRATSEGGTGALRRSDQTRAAFDGPCARVQSALVCELMDRLWHEGPQVQSTRADRQVDLMLQGHARMVGGASRPDMCCWRSCLYDSETLAVKRAIPVFL